MYSDKVDIEQNIEFNKNLDKLLKVKDKQAKFIDGIQEKIQD